ncbi:MAG: cytochrome c-type biogenesis protein CcmH [Chakrabartia sp.]
MKKLLLAFTILVMMPSGLLAQSGYNNVQLSDPKQERAAKALMETIRCVVCQGQSIADSNATLAADMRGLIRERIAKGEDPEAIRAWLIENYGDWVSFKPQIGGRSAPLWLLPLLALLIGAYLMRGRFKRKAR